MSQLQKAKGIRMNHADSNNPKRQTTWARWPSTRAQRWTPSLVCHYKICAREKSNLLKTYGCQYSSCEFSIAFSMHWHKPRCLLGCLYSNNMIRCPVVWSNWKRNVSEQRNVSRRSNRFWLESALGSPKPDHVNVEQQIPMSTETEHSTKHSETRDSCWITKQIKTHIAARIISPWETCQPSQFHLNACRCSHDTAETGLTAQKIRCKKPVWKCEYRENVAINMKIWTCGQDKTAI